MRAASALAASIALVLAPVVVAAPAAASASPAGVATLPRPSGVQDFVFQSMDVQYTLDRADDGTAGEPSAQ